MTTGRPNNIKIFAALGNDLGEGFIWLQKPGLPTRCVVKITNPASGSSVYCEALQIERNFLETYNNDDYRFKIIDPNAAIVMSEWYRAQLGGLQTQREYPLRIVAADSCWGKLQACLDHPQIVVRVAAWLGIVSVALGLIGVFLGVLSFWPRG